MNQAGGVTVHTIFWAPSGFAFQGSPGAPAPTYEGTIEKFYTDVSAASTGTSGAASACSPTNQSVCNDFTVEPQYGSGISGAPTSGNYTINYSDGGGTPQTYSGGGANSLNDTNDFIVDTDPYPAAGNGTNPTGLRSVHRPRTPRRASWTAELQNEVDKIVQATSGTAAWPAATCGTCSCRPTSMSASRWTCAGPTISAATTRFRTSVTA